MQQRESKVVGGSPVLLIASMVLANLANLAIQFVIPRVLLPAEYTQFAITWASGQLLAAVLFEWLRIGVVRYSGGVDAAAGADLRQALTSMYVLMVGVTAVLALVMLCAGLTSQSLFWAGFAVFYASVQGMFDGRQARLRASFQNLKFSLTWMARSILSFVLTIGAAILCDDAAYAMAGLCLSFVAVAIFSGPRAGMWIRPRSKEVIFLARYGFFAASAGIITYAIPVAARYVMIHLEGEGGSAGAVLSLDLAQKVVIAIGTAANLVLLQPVIRRVAADASVARSELGAHLTRIFAITAPAMVGLIYLNEFAAGYFVPASFMAAYEAIAASSVIAASLICVKSFGVDALFVVSGKTGYSALSGLVSAVIAAIGWFGLYLAGAMTLSNVMHVLVGALCAGLIISLSIAANVLDFAIPWRKLVEISFIAGGSATMARILMLSASELLHWIGCAALVALFVGGYLFFDVDGLRRWLPRQK